MLSCLRDQCLGRMSWISDGHGSTGGWQWWPAVQCTQVRIQWFRVAPSPPRCSTALSPAPHFPAASCHFLSATRDFCSDSTQHSGTKPTTNLCNLQNLCTPHQGALITDRPRSWPRLELCLRLPLPHLTKEERDGFRSVRYGACYLAGPNLLSFIRMEKRKEMVFQQTAVYIIDR